ncbi:MAG TPA: hypothetical protein VFK52_07145 [Nocardioidaceae bacterium]|nr:hypothetical protein [Nocardioidaceae bacterium]
MDETPWPPVEVAAVTATFLSLVDEADPGLVEGLYLHGSLGFGEWYAGRSDIDYVAVLSRPAPLDVLREVHAQVVETFPRPAFDGFYCSWADLAADPRGQVRPCTQDGLFSPEGDLDIHPVTWHELALNGVTVRGPSTDELEIWTSQEALRRYTHDNLRDYWAEQVDALRKFPSEAGRPENVTWFVLGTARLHHLLATNTLTSKTGAGFYAERVFDSRWHELVGEALSYRALGIVSPDYDAALMAEQVVDFAAYVVKDGLSLPV